MSRLTCKYDGINVLRDLCVFNRGNNIEADSCISCDDCCDYHQENDCDGCPIQKAFDKLADYEDLEEKGLLLKLPCKVGDTVYAITRDIISEYRICKINVYLEGIFYNWTCEKGIYPSLPYANIQGFLPYEINKTVFLTKEEAEQELKRLECAE